MKTKCMGWRSCLTDKRWSLVQKTFACGTVASSRAKRTLSPRPTGFRSCSISPDGRRLAVGAGDGLITIWDVASLHEVATLRGHTQQIFELAFHSDGNTLVSVS